MSGAEERGEREVGGAVLTIWQSEFPRKTLPESISVSLLYLYFIFASSSRLIKMISGYVSKEGEDAVKVARKCWCLQGFD